MARRTRQALTWSTWWSVEKDQYLHLADRVRTFGEGASTGDRVLSAEERRVQREALVRDRLVPLFIIALEDPDPEIRMSAAIALGKSIDARGSAPLRRVIEKDPEDDVGHTAVIGLGLLGREGDLPFLDEVLGNPIGNPRRRAFAALAIGLIGGDDAAALLTRFVTGRLPRWNAGSKEKDRLVATCYTALGVTDSADALPVLRAAAFSTKTDDTLRGHAILGLGRNGDRESRDRLAGILADVGVRAMVRRTAAIALGRVAKPADEKVVDAMIHASSEDPDVLVRIYATLSLSNVRHARVRKHLRNWFGKAQGGERPSVALALALQGDVDSVEMLRRMLEKDHDNGRRGSYCIALGLLGDQQSAPLIEDELRSALAPKHRGRAALALGLMDSQPSRDVLFGELKKGRNATLKVNLVTALAMLGDGRVRKFLLDHLDRRNSIHDRSSAAVTLGVLRVVEASRPLTEIFRNRKDDPTVRAYALVGLGFLADPNPIPRLSRLGSGGAYVLPQASLNEVLSIL